MFVVSVGANENVSVSLRWLLQVRLFMSWLRNVAYMSTGPPIAAWDNSTRGLDSQTALEFVRSLRLAADIGGLTSLIAIYQASQAIYDMCDKAIVLYEGRQIYFGPTENARAYFEEMGWYCPARQTTGDFLTYVFRFGSSELSSANTQMQGPSRILVKEGQGKALKTEYLEQPRTLKNIGLQARSSSSPRKKPAMQTT